MFFLRNYKSVIFVIFLLILALVLLSYNVKHDTGGGYFKKIVLEAAAPQQNVLSISTKSVSDAWQRYILLVGLEEKNKNLNKKIDELEANLILYKEGYLEAQRLSKLLNLRNNLNYQFISALVVAREQASLSKTILINKGSVDGLKIGMPVIAPPGLIGRLIDVSWHVSKVLLLVDENSNVAAMLQRTRLQGIIRGAGFRGGILKYIIKNQDVKEGDIIISSGMGGVFPKGLLIGKVSDVEKPDNDLFFKINVAPFADFSQLEEVLILASEEKKSK
ncbi:MAG: rod shape-determining protein MreC [Deltaproteobacteria bacterium RBG_19FT_COMBO_43_11]|nr:MAG: rod shape-determining protein MreC [Deltaproteobacteria bacterium RBG_19FT_COMBO_43_11]